MTILSLINPLINILIRDHLYLGLRISTCGSLLGVMVDACMHASDWEGRGGRSECSTGPSALSAAACKHHTFGVRTWIIEQPDRKLTNDGDPLELPYNIFIWGSFSLLPDSITRFLLAPLRLKVVCCIPTAEACPGRPNTCLLRSITEQAAGEMGNSHEERREGSGGKKVWKREQQQSLSSSPGIIEERLSVCACILNNGWDPPMR